MTNRNKRILSIALAIASIVFFIVKTDFVIAASYTWDGGGSTNNWSDCANWTLDICPTSADTVTFNGTSVKNSIVDASFSGIIASVTIASGYSGTVTLERSLTVSSTFTTSGGIFNAADQALIVTSTFTMNNGSTVRASSSTMNFGGAFTINGGTFDKDTNSGGTVIFDGTGNKNLSCNNISFNLVAIANTANTITINNNCNLPIGNNPILTGGGNVTVNGVLTGTGTLTKSSGTLTLNNAASTLSGFSGLTLTNFTVSNASVVADFSSYTTFQVTGTTSLSAGTLSVPSGATLATLTLTGGTFNAPSGILTFTGIITANSGTPTFNHNNGTIRFVGTGNKNISCTTLSSSSFNLVEIAHSANNFTVGTNCNFPMGDNPIIPSGGNVILNNGGVISGTGTLTKVGNIITFTNGVISGFTGLVANSVTVNGATLNLGSLTSLEVATTLTVSSGTLTLPPVLIDSAITISGGTLNVSDNTTLNKNLTMISGAFNASSENFNLAGNLIITGPSTFNHNNGSITLIGNNATLSCNNVAFNNVVINASGIKTISSNCTLPLGENPNSTRIILYGNLTGSGTLTFTSTKPSVIYDLSSISGFDEVIHNSDEPSPVEITRILEGSQGNYYQTNGGASPGTYVGAWVMQSKGNKLFMGWSKDIPEYTNDNTFLSYFNSVTNSFSKIMDIPEQDIHRMKIFGDTLYIPGTDPVTHGWDAGDLITVDVNTFEYDVKTYRYSTEHYVDAVTTDENGNYSFNNLKNTAYILKIIRPADYNLGPSFVTTKAGYANFSGNAIDNNFDNASSKYIQCTGNNGTMGDAGVILSSGGYTDISIDAGLVPSPGSQAGIVTNGMRDDSYFGGNVSLGDRVWVDTNENGIQDEDEAGLANVRVELYTKDPYFPCSVHSDGVWVDEDGSIYVDYAYMRRTNILEQLDIPSNTYYNFYSTTPANVLVRSTDGGENWEVVDDSIFNQHPDNLGYFAADIIKYNGYFYRNITNQGQYFSQYGTSGIPLEDGVFSYEVINKYPFVWSYSSDGSNWYKQNFLTDDIGKIEVSTLGPYTFTFNFTRNPSEQYSSLVPFRKGILVPSTYPDKINRMNGPEREEITTNVSVFGDIIPNYTNSLNNPRQDEVSGGGQRYNTIEQVDGEYVYMIGSDNKLYISTDLRNWKDVADFNGVDGSGQMVALHYWEEEDKLVISTAGSDGGIYTMNHSEIINNFLKKIQNDKGLNFFDEDEQTLDLKNIGTVGGEFSVLIKKNNLLLSKISALIQETDLDWTTVMGDTSLITGKAFIANLTSSEGAGATHSLYVPINSDSAEKFLLCPEATSFSEIGNGCENGTIFEEGETKIINELSITVTKTSIEDIVYWIASGVKGTGGMTYREEEIPENENPQNSGNEVVQNEGMFNESVEGNSDEDYKNELVSQTSDSPVSFPLIENDVVVTSNEIEEDFEEQTNDNTLSLITLVVIFIVILGIVFLIIKKRHQDSDNKLD